MGKIKSIINKLPKWNSAPKGRYLTMKEWFAYCLGGAGAMGASVFLQYVTMAAGIYIAAALNIDVDHIVFIGICTSIITILSSPLASWIIDNTNSKYGKFRPYLIWLPIPMVALFFIMGQLFVIKDYATMIVLYVIIYNILNFLNRLYSVSFNSIIQVISPSMDERVSLMSIGTFITSLGPTIVTMLYPYLANRIYSQDQISGVNTLGAVKWLLPITATIFFAVGLWFAFGVKERIVMGKNHKQKLNFVDGTKKTIKNKYFWITNLSSMLGIFRVISTSFTIWIIIYMIYPKLVALGQQTAADLIQTIIVTLIGDACVPGMLLAPLFIRKFGKKKIIIFTSLATVVFTIPMIFLKNEWALLAMIYLVTLFNGFQIVTAPAIQSEIYDYQQYKTGDRLEGFYTQFSVMITTLLGMATAFIAPAVYKSYGYFKNTDVLYNNNTLLGIISTMCLIGTVSGFLSVLPYLFYDLNEKKHNQIMNILQIRANFEDGLCDKEKCIQLEKNVLDGDTNVLDYFQNLEDAK